MKHDDQKRIAILSTGGTIEKTYSESDGSLDNQQSVLDIMLASLILHGVVIDRVPVMNKDSLNMTDLDRKKIAGTTEIYSDSYDGIVIVHGTDNLHLTGEYLFEHFKDAAPIPIVLTGAMRPYELRTTDAMQNLVESLLAVQLLSPGVYVVMHNSVLEFPGVVKDYQHRTFIREEE